MDRFVRFSLIIVLFTVINGAALAQYNPESFSAMKWRLVGPHRAGRVTCVAGIPGQPAGFFQVVAQVPSDAPTGDAVAPLD